MVRKVWRSRKMPKAEAMYGQRDRGNRVDEAERAHRPVVLDDEDIRRDHELGEHQRKGDLATTERETRERKAREGSEHKLADENDSDENERVEEIARERRGIPGAAEVLKRPRRRWRELGRAFDLVEGGPDGKEQRQHPQQRQQECACRLPERPRTPTAHRDRGSERALALTFRLRLLLRSQPAALPCAASGRTIGPALTGNAPCAPALRTGRQPADRASREERRSVPPHRSYPRRQSRSDKCRTARASTRCRARRAS